MHKILVVIGSRPEAIRAAPLICRLRGVPSMHTVVCIAAQHRQVLARELADFGLHADEELEADADLTQGVDHAIAKHKPDCVLVFGDADKAMASFRRHAAFGNLGEGLRMYELHHHSPEGAAAHLIDLTATRYFVSSESLRDHLLDEGVASENLYVTDSTEVDAVLMVAERIRNDGKLRAALADDFPFLDPDKRMVFVTGQPCEGNEDCLGRLCSDLKQLALRTDVQIVFAMRFSGQLHGLVVKAFADQPDITVIQPPEYLRSVFLMQNASLILTEPDSVPKGALSLNKPVLVLGGGNEDRQSFAEGVGELAMAEPGGVVRECQQLLDDPSHYRACSLRRNPYGDGHASQRIVETLLR